MKRPSFQFYPGDWKSNTKLRRCSEAARGAWIEVLCLLHDSEEYGVARWPMADIARAAGVALKFMKELAEKGVLKGSDEKLDAYIYTPRHAGQDGEPVALIQEGDGPCWYSSRMVRDEHLRLKRGSKTRFSEENQPTRPRRNRTPKPPPDSSPEGGIGGRQGDGASSSSSYNTPLPPKGAGGGDGGLSAESIAALYPKRSMVRESVEAVQRLIAEGADPAELAEKTRAIATVLRSWPAGHLRYAPNAPDFFRSRSYLADPEDWRRDVTPTEKPAGNGLGKTLSSSDVGL